MIQALQEGKLEKEHLGCESSVAANRSTYEWNKAKPQAK